MMYNSYRLIYDKLYNVIEKKYPKMIYYQWQFYYQPLK